MDHHAKFTREEPEVRRADLIRATAVCLSERGAAGTSVREVAARAGVSAGLIRHYFGGIDQLILATYEHIGRTVETAMDATMANAGTDPDERLMAYLSANFRPPILDRSLLSTWIAFWSLVQTNEDVHHLHNKIYAETRAKLEQMIRATADKRGIEVNTRLAALRLSSMVDGLWLELCLDPTSFTADEAIQMTHDAVAAIYV